MGTPNEPIYLKKSATFFKVYGGLFLFAIIMSVIIRPFLKDFPDVIDLFVGLPIFPLFIMAPMGLFYSWKSLKRNEGLSRTRFKYFVGHLFFCALIVLFIAVFINDISQLF